MVGISVKRYKKTKPVFGRKTLEDLNLVTRLNETTKSLEISDLLNEYKDIFQGIGKIKYQYNFHLKSDYSDKICNGRKIPFKLRVAFEKELNALKTNRIVVEENEPTEFVHPIVLAKKSDGILRICLDPQNLNSCLLRQHRQLPTFEEIASRVKGSKIFSRLDAFQAFWQIPYNGTVSFTIINKKKSNLNKKYKN